MSTNLVAPSPNPSVRRYFPGLDGLRAIAFLLVFVHHYSRGVYETWISEWGWVGVDLFFVLSGFLITGILYDSLGSRRYFRNFYVRRSLRIFPLFFGFWILLFLLTPLLHVQWNWYIASMAGYVGNFFISGSRLGFHADPGFIPLLFPNRPRGYLLVGHLWSLCIEEQFYLVWPAIVYLVRSRRCLIGICIGVMAVSPIARMVFFNSHPNAFGTATISYNTLLRVDALLCGAGLALWLRGTVASIAKVRCFASAALVGSPLLLALCLRLTGVHANHLLNSGVLGIALSLVAICCSGILLLVIDPMLPLSRVLEWKPLTFLGRISYGLYFFHELPLALVSGRVRTLAPHHLAFLVPLSAFIFSVLAAWISFTVYEVVFINLKETFAPNVEAQSTPLHNPYSVASKITYSTIKALRPAEVAARIDP